VESKLTVVGFQCSGKSRLRFAAQFTGASRPYTIPLPAPPWGTLIGEVFGEGYAFPETSLMLKASELQSFSLGAKRCRYRLNGKETPLTLSGSKSMEFLGT